MATTGFWPVRGRLKEVIDYANNPDKTTAKEYLDEDLYAAIRYVENDNKTDQTMFVSGINCSKHNAYNEMIAVKRRFGERGKNIAYHGYQSFAPGEVDAETAHEIGVKLANELWGDNFPVIVATHLDHGHIHNHFALGATGFNLKRYHDCNETYRMMREASDRLCLEYGLSVIKNPQRGKTRHIGEIKAEQEGRQTVRGIIRRDMDIAIKHCLRMQEFYNLFQSLGYTLEWRGKYLRIRPDHSTKFFRMDKLGEGYTYEDVQARILDNARNQRIIPYAPYKPKEKPKGLLALYIHYCYLLGELPKQKPNNREAYAVIKEDVRRARMYNEEAKLLGKYNINTAEELSLFTEGISKKFKGLAYQRAKLRNKLRRMHDTTEMQPIKDEISQLSLQMAELRKQMRLCEDIAARSGVIERVVNTIDIPDKELQKKEAKDAKTKETKTREREDKR